MDIKPRTTAGRSTKFADYLAAAVLAIVPFHAFLTVWFSSLIGHYTGLRLWDDVALLVLTLMAGGWLARDRELRRQWQRNVIVRLILTYAGLTLALGVVALLKQAVSPVALGYGLLVNLRYLAWFLAIALLLQRSRFLKTHWRQLVFIPAALVVLFAVLQYTILPHDFLSHFGYSETATIPPMETINHNPDYIRAQSTLRGANPLGAYLVIVIAGIGAMVLRNRRRPISMLFLAAALFALYASGSRSAWVGVALAGAIVVWLSLKQAKHRRVFLLGAAILLLMAVGAAALFRNEAGLQNALLHTQQDSKITVSSNDAHASALKDGLSDVWHQPFGAGPGTAGQASAYNEPRPERIAENYYIQIAQETGWLGVVLYIAILGLIGRELYRRARDSQLALVVFASLVGISFVCLLSHAWSDDTLAFVWWGLAGIAIGVRPSAVKARETDA